MGEGGTNSLDKRYDGDPTLGSFYKDKLLEVGWAGELDKVELEYIMENLKKDKRLRSRWGFTKGSRRLSKAKIIRRALNGLED